MPPTDTSPVRPGEEIDTAALGAWLAGHLPDFAGERISVEQFPGGHSNLTFSVTDSNDGELSHAAELSLLLPELSEMTGAILTLALVQSVAYQMTRNPARESQHQIPGVANIDGEEQQQG